MWPRFAHPAGGGRVSLGCISGISRLYLGYISHLEEAAVAADDEGLREAGEADEGAVDVCDRQAGHLHVRDHDGVRQPLDQIAESLDPRPFVDGEEGELSAEPVQLGAARGRGGRRRGL